MSDPVQIVSRALNTIQNDRLRERAAAQAVAAYDRWLTQTDEGRERLLRVMFEAGYQVSLRNA